MFQYFKVFIIFNIYAILTTSNICSISTIFVIFTMFNISAILAGFNNLSVLGFSSKSPQISTTYLDAFDAFTTAFIPCISFEHVSRSPTIENSDNYFSILTLYYFMSANHLSCS